VEARSDLPGSSSNVMPEPTKKKAPVQRRSMPAASVAGAEARSDLPGSSSIMPEPPKKEPVEGRAMTAPVQRRSKRTGSVAGAAARREPGRVAGDRPKKRGKAGPSSTDLPDSTSSPRPEVPSPAAVLEASKQSGGQKVADLKPPAFAGGGPARSEAQSKGPEERSAMRNVALDLGARKICLSEAKGGKIVHRATVRSVGELLPLLGPDTEPARVAIEACREAWAVHAKLTEWGKSVCLVDTTRSRQIGIGQHGRKTDRLDADHLALALEQERLPAAHLLSPARQELRHYLGVRRMLVEARAQAITTVRGIVRAQGERLPSCGVDAFAATVRQTSLSEATRMLIGPALVVVETLDAQLVVVEQKLEPLCAREPVIERLCTHPGVSLIVAAAFVSVIDEARRFNNAHQVESYLGLVPSEDTTGGRQRLGRITKAGNPYLRALLVQAAWSVLRQRNPNDPLKQWGEAIAARRGKRIAVVAVARRMAGVLWAMWRRNTVYDAERLGRAGARGLEAQAQSAATRAQAMGLAAKKLRLRRARIAANERRAPASI
jgi:transposase